MFSWLRTFVICLLALALPAQGMAATAMMHCGVSHQRMYGAQTLQPTSAARHHHEAAGGAGTQLGHQALVTASADEAVNTAHATAQDGDYTCAACASCCSPAAIPGSSPSLPETPPCSHWEAVAVHAVIGFVTAAPERPPRPFPA